MKKADLILENGKIFSGYTFGADKNFDEIFGEICFNTSMTGYLEIITDPSYYGQIVCLTNPHIGNYGISLFDLENDTPQIRSLIVSELCRQPSNWRSSISLHEYFKMHQLIGLEGIDTRALTKHVRSFGAMRAIICRDLSLEKALSLVKKSPKMLGADFVSKVGCNNRYIWDSDGKKSAFWEVKNKAREQKNKTFLKNGEIFRKIIKKSKFKIAALDFGIKKNILRKLRQRNFIIEVFPSNTCAEAIKKSNPDGIFLSNGPGDPAALSEIHKEIKKLLGYKPIFAICLGHQILAHALGGQTFKLKFGHRGGNQPIKDLRNGKVSITAQNHGFAVLAESLPKDTEITHINLNDNTVEGFIHRKYAILSVQYHPEAAPGPSDADYFFDEFYKMVKKTKAIQN